MKKIKKIVAVALLLSVFSAISQTDVNAAETNTVILGGEPFGVRFYNNGVVIVNLEEFNSGMEYVCPAKEGGIRINDIITEVENESVTDNEQLKKALQSSNGKEIRLKIERNGKIYEKNIKPHKSPNGNYLMGAWVRDSCAGIGTITYYEKQSGTFAALGHGVCDYDTKQLMPLGHGEILKANINSVTKSIDGSPGSLSGYFTQDCIGYLTKNTEYGIFGKTSSNYLYKNEEIKIMKNDEIKLGEACVYTTLNGETPQYYDIEITRIRNMSVNSNENFVIKITDPKLIEKCGGIVQGMSGSPIVQDGKLVGAVTHVFVNSPCEGYGITAQNMVSNYNL